MSRKQPKMYCIDDGERWHVVARSADEAIDEVGTMLFGSDGWEGEYGEDWRDLVQVGLMPMDKQHTVWYEDLAAAEHLADCEGLGRVDDEESSTPRITGKVSAWIAAHIDKPEDCPVFISSTVW